MSNAEREVSISRVIRSSPEEIFGLLDDPTQARQFDGSDTIQKVPASDQHLTLGSTFGVDMKLGPIPYKITNTVVEFEPNRLIAWQHFGKHRWRYILEPVEATASRDQGDRGVRLVDVTRSRRASSSPGTRSVTSATSSAVSSAWLPPSSE